jgi:hypothetical protein
MPARQPGHCSRADLLGIVADLSIHVVALQAKLDGKLALDFAYHSSSPAPSGSLTLHSDYRTNKFGHRYRLRNDTLNDGDCPGCGAGMCICSDEEQLARLLPPSAKSTKQTRGRAKSKPKTTTQTCAAYNEGKCKLTHLKSHRPDRGVVWHICDFCFTKTGKQFFHAEIDCNRKNKFSKKVECHKKSEKKLSKNM